MPISQFNNWNAPLAAFGFPGDVFNGAPEETGTAAAISVNILCSTHTTLTIQQSYNKTNWYYEQQYQIQQGEQSQLATIQMPVVLPYFRVNILNQEQVTQTYCNMNTSLVPQLTQNFDIRPLTAATDSVSITTPIDVSGNVGMSAKDITTGIEEPLNSAQTTFGESTINMLSTFSIASYGAQQVSSITAYGADFTGATAVYSPIPLTGNLAEEATSVLISGKTLCQGINDTNGNPTIVNVKTTGGYPGQSSLKTSTQAFYSTVNGPDYSTPDSSVGVFGSQWNLDYAGQTQSLCVSERKNAAGYGDYVDLLVNDKELNAKIITCDTSSIAGTVNVVLPNTIYNTTFATITGPATGDPVDIGATGLISVVISADSVTGDFFCGIQYSHDGTVWIDSESGTLTTSALAFGVTGLFIGAPLVRLNVPSATTETATNLKFSLFGKAL